MASARPAHSSQPLVGVLAVALGYALLGRLGLLLTPTGEVASPLYPAAGFALAVVVVRGWHHLPAIALGAFAANLWFNAAQDWQPPLLIAMGATAQAAVGAWLVKRFCTSPLVLHSPRDMVRFVGLGLCLANLISPTWATLCLALVGHLPSAQWTVNWGTWWIGDTLGGLIGAPLTLAWIGQPPEAWRPRRLTVGLPLLAATILVGLGTHEINGWGRQRVQESFGKDAELALQRLTDGMSQAQRTLNALNGFAHSPALWSRAGVEAASGGLMQDAGPVLGLGLAQRLARGQAAALERAARAEGLAEFAVHDHYRTGELAPDPDDMLVVRWVEPLSRQSGLLGENLRSMTAVREAAEIAWASGQPVSTSSLTLGQRREASRVVLLMQAVPVQARLVREGGSGPAEMLAFVVVSPQQLLRRAAAGWPAGLEACVADVSTPSAPVRLAGSIGCERLGDEDRAQRQRTVLFGGRPWQLTIAQATATQAEAAYAVGHSWPFALMGLCATALGGMLLLLISGRTQQVEAEVRDRTAELRREIQERSSSERALRESEERFRSVFERAPIGIVFSDFNGRYLEVNPRFAELLDRPAEDLVGRLSSELTHPDDREADQQLGQQLLRGEISMFRREKRYLRPDGSGTQVRVWVSLLRGPDGRPNRFIAVVEDVTDELRAQEAERVRSAAEAANQAKNDFLSRMSHELRTPMNAILGFTQLMLLDHQEPLPAGQRARVEQIGSAGWHLLEMINDTLDLSRIESGVLRVDCSEQHLPSLITRALSLVHGMAVERSIRIDSDIATASATVWGDATRIVQILTNLLSNALKYNQEGGWVQLTVRHPDAASLEVRVRDSGPGLTPAQRAGLFQPFNRLGQEQSAVPGTGIGLVISRHLAEMMGGRLEAADVAPPGACFVFTLRSAADSPMNAAE